MWTVFANPGILFSAAVVSSGSSKAPPDPIVTISKVHSMQAGGTGSSHNQSASSPGPQPTPAHRSSQVIKEVSELDQRSIWNYSGEPNTVRAWIPNTFRFWMVKPVWFMVPTIQNWNNSKRNSYGTKYRLSGSVSTLRQTSANNSLFVKNLPARK